MKNKTVISLISGFLSLSVIGATTLVVTNLINNDLNHHTNDKPLNRGDNYEQYNLSSYLVKDVNLRKILKATLEEGNKKYIDEVKLQSYLRTEFRDVLEKIPKFRNKKDQYQFKFHYLIHPNKQSALLDIVWFIPNTDWYYFDQINIKLK